MLNLASNIDNCNLVCHSSSITDDNSVLHRIRQRKQNGNYRTVEIRLADTDDARSAASMVINRRYGARGYGKDHLLAEDRNKVTFLASSSAEIFGTITLGFDSELGLVADSTFPEEVAEIRNQAEAMVCELTKFAFDTARDSRPYLAGLFHIVYLYGTQQLECSDLLIEVNPRHIRFYEKMLGFKRVGPERLNNEVGAPSQLMHIHVSEIGMNINRYAGELHAARHSLYPYFFSSKEEAGLRKRIAAYYNDSSATTNPQSIPKIEMLAL